MSSTPPTGSSTASPLRGIGAGAPVSGALHRVAISNDRLLRLEDDRVYFRWKDYADGGETKTTHLEATEFVRRFLLHVLPDRFHRIRYYGLFANRNFSSENTN